jgi:hypothetical protein
LSKTLIPQNIDNVLTDAMRAYVASEAGMFVDQAEAYIPGLLAAILAALKAHKLSIKPDTGV